MFTVYKDCSTAPSSVTHLYHSSHIWLTPNTVTNCSCLPKPWSCNLGVHGALPEKCCPNLFPDGSSVSPSTHTEREVPLSTHGTDTYFVHRSTESVTLDTVFFIKYNIIFIIAFIGLYIFLYSPPFIPFPFYPLPWYPCSQFSQKILSFSTSHVD